mmetsp:Transcript_12695/g.11252  ORF Transcript_12695/g.11252 Transcript_12695/m.11252 type:complete len:117 (-) Transcript_12695:27-377(-)
MEETKDNIIEAINEGVYFFSCLVFSFSAIEQLNTLSIIIIYIFLASGIVITAIIYGIMIAQIIQKCKSRNRKEVIDDILKPQKDLKRKTNMFEESKENITNRDITKLYLADHNNIY